MYDIASAVVHDHDKSADGETEAAADSSKEDDDDGEEEEDVVVTVAIVGAEGTTTTRRSLVCLPWLLNNGNKDWLSTKQGLHLPCLHFLCEL